MYKKLIVFVFVLFFVLTTNLSSATTTTPAPEYVPLPSASTTQPTQTEGFTYKTLVDIPGLGENGLVTISPNSLGLYLQVVFNYIIGAAIALAVVMIMWGGFTYATTDVIGKKEEGKNIIWDAFYGLALALGSFLILNTINPDLLKFDLGLPRLAKTELQNGTLVDITAGRLEGLQNGVSGGGGAQNGAEFTPSSNSMIVACPSALTRHQGKPICPELLSRLQAAAAQANVTLSLGQTFDPPGSRTPSKSVCHTPGGGHPSSGSCADVGFVGRPGMNQPGWGAFCQAIGTTPGLFTNNEASNLEECTRYVGRNNASDNTSGPHLHVIYTGGGAVNNNTNAGGDGSYGGDLNGAYLEGTYDNPTLSPGVASMVEKLRNGKSITQIQVTQTQGSDGNIAFFIDNKSTPEVTLPVKIGANGTSPASCAVGSQCRGDKKTPTGNYTLNNSRWNPPSPTPKIANTLDGRRVSMGLAVFGVIPGRQIYIHGTRNDPREPTSGCIRMRNDDIIVIGRYLHVGIPVRIR